jgi:hypothetical protein
MASKELLMSDELESLLKSKRGTSFILKLSISRFSERNRKQAKDKASLPDRRRE